MIMESDYKTVLSRYAYMHVSVRVRVASEWGMGGRQAGTESGADSDS